MKALNIFISCFIEHEKHTRASFFYVVSNYHATCRPLFKLWVSIELCLEFLSRFLTLWRLTTHIGVVPHR